MMSDLFRYALDRMGASAGTDWKAPLARLHARYEAADDEATRRRLEADMVDAFMPMAAFISLKHSCPGIGFTAADAFEVGCPTIMTSLRRFDPALTQTGRRGLLNYVAQSFEWEILHAKKRSGRHAAAGVTSLDALESLDEVPELSETDDTSDVGRSGVRSVVDAALADMTPVDRWCAERRLANVSWQKIADDAVAELGISWSRQTWRNRWNDRVAPQLQAAMTRAGYGPEDIGRNDD